MKMSALSTGLSTFNSCNKAGSIPHFTQYLTRYPNDYRALTWRGRAYSIIGKTSEAKADFQKACRVSFGSQKLLAEAHIENIHGNMKQKVAILQNTTIQYPNCSEAWHDLGSHTYHIDKEVDLSLQYLERADHLATINSETGEPWYPWCSQTIGDIFFEKKQVNEARKHYAKAVQSCNTLTIGHLRLSICDILQNNLASAKTSFLTAKRLNPVLVESETFDDFLRQFQPQPRNQQPSAQYSSGANPKAQTHKAASGYQAGKSGRSSGSGGRGNGGSGDGSGSDDEDLSPEQKAERKWENIKKEAPSTGRKKYNGNKYFQSKDKSVWISKIKPSERHGGAFFKKYKDKGRTIELIASLDENMKEMTAKHESGKYAVIEKSKMQGI